MPPQEGEGGPSAVEQGSYQLAARDGTTAQLN